MGGAAQPQKGGLNQFGVSQVSFTSEMNREIERVMQGGQQRQPSNHVTRPPTGGSTFGLAAKGLLQNQMGGTFSLNDQNYQAQAINMDSINLPDLSLNNFNNYGSLNTVSKPGINNNNSNTLGGGNLSYNRSQQNPYSGGAANTVQSNLTFDLEGIDRRNEERLNRLKALGLNTVNESQGGFENNESYARDPDELDKLD